MYYLKVYKNKVANAKLSLVTPISIQTLLGNIKNESSISNSKPLQGYKELFFWDLGVNATNKINIGDTLFIKSGNDLFRSKIEIILKDSEGGIGDAIGWALQFKSPWQNPIGLIDMKRIVIDRHLENKIEDEIETGSKEAKNFYQIKKDPYEQKKPASKIQDEPSSSVSVSPKKNASELHDLISQIILLKNVSHHSEREHESLVEKFFLYLGYNYPVDIRYRVGHIDVLINSESNNSIVIEVKRNWKLSRQNKDVIDQAYGYASNIGSRFVVITNGDYYAFFDRLRGLSINDNFDFELKLTQISDKEIQLLKKYKKSSLL